MKRVVCLIIGLFLLIGCATDDYLNSNENLYSTKNQALEAFRETNNIDGVMVEIKTTNNKTFLLSESSDKVFLLGEIKENGDSYTHYTLTAKLALNNTTAGGAMEFTTINEDDIYRVQISLRETMENYYSIENTDYYFNVFKKSDNASIVEKFQSY